MHCWVILVRFENGVLGRVVLPGNKVSWWLRFAATVTHGWTFIPIVLIVYGQWSASIGDCYPLSPFANRWNLTVRKERTIVQFSQYWTTQCWTPEWIQYPQDTVASILPNIFYRSPYTVPPLPYSLQMSPHSIGSMIVNLLAPITQLARPKFLTARGVFL